MKSIGSFCFIDGVRNVIIAEGRTMEEISNDAWIKARKLAFAVERKVNVVIEIGSLTFGQWVSEFEA